MASRPGAAARAADRAGSWRRRATPHRQESRPAFRRGGRRHRHRRGLPSGRRPVRTMSRGFANYRIALVVVAILTSFAGVGARLVSLHVLQREKFLSYIEKAREEIIVQNARRGDILDAHGSLLATSRPLIVLGADPQAMRREDQAKW